MKFSPFPLKATDAARWYIERSEYQSFDTESAQHLIQSFVACGSYRKAAAFTRKLVTVPMLFGECTLTLMESLCEYRYAQYAREISPWFERRIRSKEHSFKPCDIYLIIAETNGNRDDFVKAKNAVRLETNSDERTLRLVRIFELARDLDPDSEEMELLEQIRTYARSRLQSDLVPAFLISAALTVSTQQECDFTLACEIVGCMTSQMEAKVYKHFVDELISIAAQMPERMIRQAMKKQTSTTVRKSLRLALASEPSHPEEMLH